MTNLFENIKNRIIDKINYLSNQIQDYIYCKSLLNDYQYIEEENENKQKQL